MGNCHKKNKVVKDSASEIISRGSQLDMVNALKDQGIVLPRYIGHVYIFVFVNIEIKTLELFTCNGWLHTLGL